MQVKLAILTLAVLLAVPATAVASWGSKGSLEPDTAIDQTAGYQWPGTDIRPCGSGTVTSTGCDTNDVYLNGFITQAADPHFDSGVSDVNPNFATVGSEHPSWMGLAVALLGVWKDCNGDGYMGLGDNGLFEYRETILADTSLIGGPGESICPVKASAPSHNDGTWIHEFIPIGPEGNNVPTVPDKNKWDLADANARVWFDWNRPGDLPAPNRCYIFAPASSDPVAHPEWGTFHSTGGMLAFADCWDDEILTTTIDSAATGPLAGFSFTDHPTDQWNSSSTLNQRNPWGQPGDATVVDSWDCSQGPVAKQGGNQVSAPRVPPTTNPGGTLAGTLEYESDGLIDCKASTDPPAAQGGQNQNSYVLANVPYAAETGGVYQVVGPKIAADFLLQYDEGSRPAVASAALGPSGGKTGGVYQVADTDGLYTATATISENSNPYVNRANLQGQTIQGVEYATTYATISRTDVTANPAGKSGTYGAENCGSFTSGVHNGWDCDPSDWYPGYTCTPGYGYSCTGTVNGAPVSIAIRAGASYQLMDVDCYDNSVNGARANGVGWGVLTGTMCE